MIYPNRPRIKLTLLSVDKLLEILGWGVVCAMWILVIINYSKLPTTIPVHFNSSGAIDGYGAKSMIWGLVLIGSFIYMGLTYLNKFPHIFNYPTQITEENAFRQYTIATMMLRFIKFIIVLMIGSIIFKTIRIAFGEEFTLVIWSIPLFLGLLFSLLTYLITLMIIKR